MKTFHTILVCLNLMTFAYAADESSKPTVQVKYGILNILPGNSENGVIGHERVGDEQLWVAGVHKNGSTRQVRITSRLGGRGSGKQLVRLHYPFGDASATWNMDIKLEGDVLSVMLPWNGTLIGDIMDVNEGEGKTEDARRKLGLTTPDSKLPVMYITGDSISLGYWPYLEASLHDEVNVYYQRELAKDIPDVKLRNNGHAHLAYEVLLAAYMHDNFEPDYWMVNFGLHMINSHQNNLPAYDKWIDNFIAYAKLKNVDLIFVNTTPYRQSFRPKRNLIIVKFNELMEMNAKRHGVPVIDLHDFTLSAVKERGDKKVFHSDGVHFTEGFRKQQAEHIAMCVQDMRARDVSN